MVSIIIVNYGNPQDTLACLDSLKLITYRSHEIIVVDNGCETDRTSLFKEHNPICDVVPRKENGGFAAGANVGIRKAVGEYILLLNNDTVVSAGFLEPLVQVLNENPTIGMASPQIRYYDSPEIIQYAGASSIHPILVRGRKHGFKQSQNPKFNKSEVTGLCNGACMLIKRQVFEDIGLLPEKYFMYYEEHDFTQHAKFLGWNCYYTGNSIIYHKGSKSLGNESPLKTYYLFRNRILYARTFQQGTKLGISLCYLYLVSLAATFQKYRAKDYANAKSILKAMSWHFTHLKISSI